MSDLDRIFRCDSGEKNSDNKRVNNMPCQRKNDFEAKDTMKLLQDFVKWFHTIVRDCWTKSRGYIFSSIRYGN